MPCKMVGSLSITMARIPLRPLLRIQPRFSGFCLTAFSGSPKGISMLKTVPLVGHERTFNLWPSIFAMRSVMARPSPNPCTWECLGLSMRRNSSKTSLSLSSAMPTPVSHTSILSMFLRRLQPSSILPSWVQRMAFDKKFCITLRRSCWSDLTILLQATK